MVKSKENCRQSGCPIAFTLEMLGDKWTLLIIRDMLFLGKKYYGEFIDSAEKIASNILADRLKRLEANTIITKTLDPENQKKYIYELTSKGIDLIPIILEAIFWASKHDPATATPKDFIQALTNDRAGLTQQLIDAYRAILRPT